MIEIRSYRAVFDLERRIYRVDQLRLNPGGIPVRGVVYFLAVLLAMLVAGDLPLAGAVIGALPWYLRDLALPVASATLLSVIRIEGRPFHLAAYALLRYRTGPRRLSGFRPRGAPGARWRPQEILMLPDGSDGEMRRLRYTGPGAVLVTVAHERIDRGRQLRPDGGREMLDVGDAHQLRFVGHRHPDGVRAQRPLDPSRDDRRKKIAHVRILSRIAVWRRRRDCQRSHIDGTALPPFTTYGPVHSPGQRNRCGRHGLRFDRGFGHGFR